MSHKLKGNCTRIPAYHDLLRAHPSCIFQQKMRHNKTSAHDKISTVYDTLRTMSFRQGAALFMF